MNECTTVYLPTESDLSYFQFGVIIIFYDAVVNILYEHNTSFFWEKYLCM
jgi:hypothetical protein